LLDENLIENIDEIHFVVNIDSGRTLGFLGETSIKYAEEVSSEDSITTVERISEGHHAIIEAPMLIVLM